MCIRTSLDSRSRYSVERMLSVFSSSNSDVAAFVKIDSKLESMSSKLNITMQWEKKLEIPLNSRIIILFEYGENDLSELWDVWKST